MLGENRKKELIMTLTAGAFLIEMIMLLHFILPDDKLHSFHKLIYEIGLFRWGWFLVFCLVGVALGGLIYWKPGGLLLRGIVTFFSVITLVVAVLWFVVVMCISRLKF